MTDKELIKEEIEYRLSSGRYSINSKQALLDIIVFINSLPKESGCEVNFTTKSEDLEEAMELSVSEEPLLEFFATGQPTIGAYNEDSLRNQFEAGAEWQKQQMKEVLQTEYEKGRFDMQQEMMKDAVELEVCDNGCEKGLQFLPVYQLHYEYIDGDKVKIIIIKEK